MARILRNGQWVEIETGVAARKEVQETRVAQAKVDAEDAELIKALKNDDYSTIERLTGIPMYCFKTK